VEKDPKDAEAYALLGSVSMAKGDTGAAKADFERALELQPDVEGRYAALANFHARTGDLAGAEEVVKQGLARLPKSTVLQISQAGLSERKGEFEAAIQSYEGALETDPLSLVAVNNLASLLAEYRTDPQSLERAYTLSRRLKDLDNPFFQDTVGWVHYRRGEYQAAEDLLAQAAKGLPKLAIVHYHLGKAQQALGDKASAVQSLQQSLALTDDTGFPQKSVVQSALDEIAAGGPGTGAPVNSAPAQAGSGNG
jgi:tetratricopeptide (TPR) repeat protein